MRRQNGKEEGVTASWEDKLSRYNPQNKVVEVEVEAFFFSSDDRCSKRSFRHCSIQEWPRMKV
jgi:hypothetical protein